MANKSKTYNIDAKGKSLGRLASEVATLLRGKREVNYFFICLFHLRQFTPDLFLFKEL